MPLSAAGIGVESPLTPLLSLMALLSSLIFVSLEPVVSLLTSSAKMALLVGARQVGTSHTTPVKLRIWKPFFAHLRQGFPDRSRARRLALMVPILALGPSFWTGVEAAKGPLLFGSLIMSPIRCFFLGPGLPRGFGVPSSAAAPLFVPLGFGPGARRPFFPAPATGGASRLLSMPFTGVAASSGVSTGAGSTIWAGVSGDDDDDDESFEGSDGFGSGSWGNLASFPGDSGRTTTRDFAAPALVVDMAPAATARCCGDETGGWQRR